MLLIVKDLDDAGIAWKHIEKCTVEKLALKQTEDGRFLHLDVQGSPIHSDFQCVMTRQLVSASSLNMHHSQHKNTTLLCVTVLPPDVLMCMLEYTQHDLFISPYLALNRRYP